jgi:hypothetical protein
MSSEGRPNFVRWFLGPIAAACVVVAVRDRFPRGENMSGSRWIAGALITGIIAFTWRTVWDVIVKGWKRIWPAATPFNPRWLVMDLWASNSTI